MTASRISSREDAEKYLISRCERCLNYLREISAIHLSVENSKATETDPQSEHVFRLRKALFHIQMVVSWIVDADVLHVMGPDIRAARQHIEPIILNYTEHDLEKGRNYVGEIYKKFETYKKLADFSHPTPARLIMSLHEGGLGRMDMITCFFTLCIFLMGLVADYALALDIVLDDLDRTKQQEVCDVADRSNSDFYSWPLHTFLRFVAAEEAP